ncbi:MAG: LLM class F420-dependent oxidoreductase [Chloroflexota bacterium]
MQIGVHLPHVGPQATRTTLIEFAHRMEALGYDSFWVSDHVVIPRHYESRYPYHPSGRLNWTDLPLLEPLSTLLFVAAVTERAKLGTTVLVIPMRNPVLHAKIMATLDHLSSGRFILGAGTGWLREEFEALATPFDHRGARMDEYLQVIKNLWTKDDPSFEGRYYRLGNVACYPRPAQQPHPPIWIGGNTEPALRRAARLGDAWHGAGSTPEEVAAAAEKLRAYAREAGRAPEAVAVTVRTGLPAGEDPDAVLERMRRYQDAGVSHLCLETSFRDMARAYETLERFAREVRPKLG